MKNIQNNLMHGTQLKNYHPDGTEMSIDDISRKVLKHHMKSFQDNNVETVIADYTNESVLITEVATYVGRDEIASFFMDLITHFPRQQTSFNLDKMVVKDELAFIVWHAKTPSLEVPLASETFVFRDGKILRQTFIGQLKFTR